MHKTISTVGTVQLHNAKIHSTTWLRLMNSSLQSDDYTVLLVELQWGSSVTDNGRWGALETFQRSNDFVVLTSDRGILQLSCRRRTILGQIFLFFLFCRAERISSLHSKSRMWDWPVKNPDNCHFECVTYLQVQQVQNVLKMTACSRKQQLSTQKSPFRHN